jgi:hypothetical protein
MTGRLDHRAHRSFRSSHARIGAIALNLIAAELGLIAFASHDDGAAGGVDFDRVAISDLGRHHEYLAEHFDDVIVGVIVVIEQDDVEQRRQLSFIARFAGGAWRCSDVGRDGRTRGHLCIDFSINGKMDLKGGATDSTELHLAWEVVPGSELP